MAPIENAINRIASALGNERSQSLLHGVIRQAGGMQGLAKRFNTSGMAEVFNSWVAVGENVSIKPEQIDAVLDNQMVQQVAQKLGLDTSKAKETLATLLPQLVDQLTPGGKLEEALQDEPSSAG